MKRHALFIGAVCSTLFTVAEAADIGHYNPGDLNIRNFIVPEPGLYGALFTYYYTTDHLNNRNGDHVNSVTIGTTSGPVTLNFNVSVNIYAVSPAVVWVRPFEILGARYGAYISPTFANGGLSADFSDAEGNGGTIRSSKFSMGDLLVQPLWLGWTKKHWDLSLGYGFYAPVGRFDAENRTLRNGATVKVQSPDSIGFGFWTQRVQGAAAWYPMTNKTTAVVFALTYEYNGKTEDFELKPGQMLTLNWGVSQFLPLSKSQHFIIEVGPAGYDTWQITETSGGDARLPDVRSQVHAVGGQISLRYTPRKATLNLNGFYEYAAIARFQGAALGVNMNVKF